MNKNFLIFKNLDTREEKICFWRQIVCFLLRLRRNVHDYSSKENFSSEELQIANANAFCASHIRCYAIDYAIELHPAKEAAQIIFDLCALFEDFRADRKSHRRTERRLMDFQKKYPHLIESIIFAWDPNLTSFYATDELAWKYFLQRDRNRPWMRLDVDAFLGSAQTAPQNPANLGQLTASQAQALEQLDWLYRARQKKFRACGIEPKTHALVIGSSGAGKSFVVNAFARKHALKIFETSLASWTIVGGHSEAPMVKRIADWLSGIDGGNALLFIDEIEKVRVREQTSEYTRYLVAELMDTLDSRVEHFEGWNRDLAMKLKEKVMIICAGAFQDLYEKQVGDTHFAEQWEDVKLGEKIWRQDRLPQELLFRLSPAIIEITPPTAQEISMRVLAAHRDLGITQPSEPQLTQIAQKILLSKQNLRGVEKYILDRWIEKQRLQK